MDKALVHFLLNSWLPPNVLSHVYSWNQEQRMRTIACIWEYKYACYKI